MNLKSGFPFWLEVHLDQPPTAGARYRVEQSTSTFRDTRPSIGGAAGDYPERYSLETGTVRIAIHQVNWDETVPERTAKRGWACGEIEADFVGKRHRSEVRAPFTFKGEFRAEITRPASARRPPRTPELQ